jgi:hypothetical protein
MASWKVRSALEKAEECKELKAALEKWGYSEPEKMKDTLDKVEENQDDCTKRLLNQAMMSSIL